MTNQVTAKDGKKLNSFKKDWSAEDFKTFKKVALKFFQKNKFEYNTQNGAEFEPLRPVSFSQLDNIFGFAYTSTGICAGEWACNGFNVRAEFLGEFIGFVGFVVSDAGEWFAWFENEDEKPLFIEIN